MGSPRAAARLVRKATRARKRAERAEVRRFTRQLRRRRLAWLISGAVLVALASVVALGAFSPLFALRDIEVQGASRVPPAAIVDALSGELGRPLPLVDAGAVRSALSKFPLIETYTTESRPPGTLVVRIVERTPVAVVAAGAAFDLVDSAGVVLDTTPTRPAGFPIIDLQGAGRTDVPFTAAAAVLVALPADLRAQVDSITARTTDDVSLVLTGGQRVVWGSAADSVRKAQHLAALLRQAPTNVSEYDVSSPGVGILR
ncbi:FtsQ-type POTRA domain-containing protein [Naasia aerilata]|uniref:POTRA domain-containing protein n=1 Tax=Naasia aerilata TaxID=1162966 RepID=A0ABN6XQW0_9MICO|nr:FtsQ-type POTRA domain-containing protein [Naasia aerilata]BDZ47351.1 hypothetical protein GCM10025866_32600 [Naasia aerilata]